MKKLLENSSELRYDNVDEEAFNCRMKKALPWSRKLGFDGEWRAQYPSPLTWFNSSLVGALSLSPSKYIIWFNKFLLLLILVMEISGIMVY